MAGTPTTAAEASSVEEPPRGEQLVLGMPRRFMRPTVIQAISMIVAVTGMYSDIAWHIDRGRDEGLFTLPHNLILLGIFGMFVGAVEHARLRDPAVPGEVRLPALSFSPGGLVLLVCSVVSLLAFPLDELWHRLFGQDVTLWGPTHLLLFGGPSVATIGLWLLLRQGLRLGSTSWLVRATEVRVAGAVLIGMNTFHAEFDFGVPQFQLLYHPVLVAGGGALALVVARTVLGRFGAIKALALFYLVRGILALVLSALDFTMPHFPLYLAEAVCVEVAALLFAGSLRRFALATGVLVGTVGFAAEWAWSQAWFYHPWPGGSFAALAVACSLAAAVGAALLGARIGLALRRAGGFDHDDRSLGRWPVALGGVLLLAALVVPLPRTGGDGTMATIDTTAVRGGEAVEVAVTLDPPDAASGAEWFEVVAWQGGSRRHLIPLDQQGRDGRYVSRRPVPVGGEWKSLVRLADGTHLMAASLHMPASPASDRPAIVPGDRTVRLTSDTFQLQREARGGTAEALTVAYLVVLGTATIWLTLVGVGLARGERMRETAARGV